MTQCQAAQLADVSLEDLHRETLLALHAASHPPQAGGDTNETQLQRPPIAPLLASLADKCAELRRREIVTQAVPGLRGAYCVIDVEGKRLRWLYGTDEALDLDAQGDALAAALLPIAEHALAAANGVESYAYQPEGVRARVVGAVDLGSPNAFDGRRSVLIALETSRQAPEAPEVERKLSPREREIARLLVAGYAAINAAALLDLSEHTVRTYIRRLYRKLEVSNRADLVRKLVVAGATQLPPHAQSQYAM